MSVLNNLLGVVTLACLMAVTGCGDSSSNEGDGGGGTGGTGNLGQCMSQLTCPAGHSEVASCDETLEECVVQEVCGELRYCLHDGCEPGCAQGELELAGDQCVDGVECNQGEGCGIQAAPVCLPIADHPCPQGTAEAGPCDAQMGCGLEYVDEDGNACKAWMICGSDDVWVADQLECEDAG